MVSFIAHGTGVPLFSLQGIFCDFRFKVAFDMMSTQSHCIAQFPDVVFGKRFCAFMTETVGTHKCRLQRPILALADFAEKMSRAEINASNTSR
jgi:hypothetical protein